MTEAEPEMETLIDTPTVRIIRVPDAGPYGNNIYVIVDPTTGESALVDAPAEPEKAIEAAKGTQVTAILITHGHSDHLDSLDTLREHFGAKVYGAAGEINLRPGQIDVVVADGDEVLIGATRWRAIHNPGHTPGSTSYFYQDRDHRILFSGDTLFPGGPGWSATPMHLRHEIESIRERLLTLPPETRILPGHGPTGTIRQSRAQFAVFTSKPHRDDLHGDVLWLSS